MNKRMITLIAISFCFLLFGMTFLFTKVEGTQKKAVAKIVVEEMASNVGEVDKRIRRVLATLKTNDSLDTLIMMQDDFNDRGFMVEDEDFIAYNITLEGTERTLEVNYNYYLENSGYLLGRYFTILNDYKLVVVDNLKGASRKNFREWLGLGDHNYLYYEEALVFDNEDSLYLVGYVDKPLLYPIIYPQNFKDRVVQILYIGFLFLLSYSLISNLNSYYMRREARIRDTLTDPLTGLYNRRYLDKFIFTNEKIIAILDLDDFKSINDSVGHVGGDKVLKSFSEALMKATRDNDVIVRMGGDEFLIILETSEVAAMSEVIERIKRNTDIKFSCGFETYNPKRSFEENLEDIDLKLYEAKKRKA